MVTRQAEVAATAAAEAANIDCDASTWGRTERCSVRDHVRRDKQVCWLRRQKGITIATRLVDAACVHPRQYDVTNHSVAY